MASSTQNEVHISVSDPRTGGQYTVPARIAEVQGRNATLKAENGILEGKSVQSITTMGRDGPTMAERGKAAELLKKLQEPSAAYSNCFLQLLWPYGSDSELE